MQIARLFSFPNPVNEVSARLVAGAVVILAGCAVALQQRWLLVPLAYGFLARVLTGPRLSPIGQLVTRVITPRLSIADRFVAGPPKRFAQGVGAAVSLSAVALAFSGHDRLGWVLVVALISAASLEAFAGYCLGCKAFAILMRVGFVPASVCLECADVSDRLAATRSGAA